MAFRRASQKLSHSEILIKFLTLARTLSFGCTGTESATGNTVTLRFKTLRRSQVTTKEFFHNVRLSTVTAKSDHKSYHLKCLRCTVISNYIRRSQCKNCQFLKPRLWSTTKKKGRYSGQRRQLMWKTSKGSCLHSTVTTICSGSSSILSSWIPIYIRMFPPEA